MLTREVKLKTNKKIEAILDAHIWHLTGVYNWALRQIECELNDCQKPMGPLSEQIEYDLVYSKKPNKVRLKPLKINTKEFPLFDKVSGNAKTMDCCVSNEAVLSMIYQARNAWDRCLTKLGGVPRLKGKRNRLNGFSFYGDCRIDLKNGIALLPKIGKVRFKSFDIGDHLQGKKIQAHITLKHRADGWYLLFRVDAKHQQVALATTTKVGSDPGMTTVLSLNNGVKFEAPTQRQKAAEQMARIQLGISKNKEMAKRLKGNKNGNTLRHYNPKSKLARQHLKLTRQLKDQNHKISHNLVRDYAGVYWSDDNFRAQQVLFGKRILSNAPGQLREMITYKSQSCGRSFVPVSNKNSTVTCSACKSLTGPRGWSGLKVRYWMCVGCGAYHDRDRNAAQNTFDTGSGHDLEQIGGSAVRATKPPKKTKQAVHSVFV